MNNTRKEHDLLETTVYPSTVRTMSVIKEKDGTPGAHTYYLQNCGGFENGETKYVGTEQQVRFVRKDELGNTIPGLQSEQLVLVLLDRAEKLNQKFPSDQNSEMIRGLQIFLDACKARIDDRIDRGVMGQLKK